MRYAIHDERRFHVYAVFCQDGDGPTYVKFGMSSLIDERIQNICAGSPIPAKLFAIAETNQNKRAALNVERALHMEFADRRVRGEWYKFDTSCPKDKREFNEGCRRCFKICSRSLRDNWWTQISARAVEAHREQRRRELARCVGYERLVARENNCKEYRDYRAA